MPTLRDSRHLVVSAVVTCTVGALVHGRAGTLMALIAAAATAILVAFTRQAVQHRRLSRGLHARSRPGRLAGLPVRFVDTDTGPVVAGLVRPAIYCGPNMTSQLSVEELRAVALHELAHVRAFDPLRLTLLRAVSPVLDLTAPGRTLHASLRAEREVLADRFAMAHGVTPHTIAAALTRMPSRTPPRSLAGFSTSTDIRLRSLLGAPAPRPSIRAFWLVVGVAAGAVLCVSDLEPDRLVAAVASINW